MYRRIEYLLFPVLAALALLASRIAAANDCAGETCVATGRWEYGVALGLGYANNPLVAGDDLKLPLLPHIAYYGKQFFIENTSFGYTLQETPAWRFNLLSRSNLDYLYFAQNGSFLAALNPPFPSPHPYPGPPPANLKDRRLTWLAGVEASWFQGNWKLQSSLLRDVSVGHHGVEADLALFRHFESGWHQLDAGIAVKYRDQALTDYYYGLDRGEFVDPKYDYKPGATISPYTTLNYRYELDEDMRIVAMFALQRAGDGIADSPIVATRWFSAGFVGVAYDF